MLNEDSNTTTHPDNNTTEDAVQQGRIPSSSSESPTPGESPSAVQTSTSPASVPARKRPKSPDCNAPVTNANIRWKFCPRCKKSVMGEPQRAVQVVTFGSSAFHVDCFRCTKCDKQVNPEQTLIKLPDGSPICMDCSPTCALCHKVTPYEPMFMTCHEEAFHGTCFKCKTCNKSLIDDTRFGRTSTALFCMQCYHVRMDKIEKRLQKKAAKRAQTQDGDMPDGPP